MDAISHCFFCLEIIPPDSKLNGIGINLKCLYKLLKINSEGYQAKPTCEECLETLEKFNELYMCLEVIQMELYDCLKQVQNSLVKNKCSPSQHLFGKLRNIIISKCNTEISKSKPMVKVKKWDSSQSHSLITKEKVAPSNLNYYVEENVYLNHDLTGDTEPVKNPAIPEPITIIKNEHCALEMETLFSPNLIKSAGAESKAETIDHYQADPKTHPVRKSISAKHNEVENHLQLQANYNEGNQSCLLCKKEFRNFYRFKRHFESIHMQFSCNLCKNYSSNWEWELDKHMRMCHPEHHQLNPTSLNQKNNGGQFPLHDNIERVNESAKIRNLTIELLNSVQLPLNHKSAKH